MSYLVEVYNRAEALLDERGWRQGVADADDPRLTLSEAVGIAITDEPLRRFTNDEAALYRCCVRILVDCMDPDGPQLLMTWNDTWGRTVDEVQLLLQRAAWRVSPRDSRRPDEVLTGGQP